MKKKTAWRIIALMLVVFFGLIGAAQAFDSNAFDFVVYGDSHAGLPEAAPIHQSVIDKIMELDPNFIIHTGDYTHLYVPEGCDLFNSMTQGLRANHPYYLSTGNHDVDKPCAADPWYSFNYKNTLFVSLEVPSQTSVITTERYEWLKDILRNSNKKFKIVYFHNPPYSQGARGCNTAIRLIDSLLRDYKVDIVFNGHTHAYERFKIGDVNYVVSGGAGGGFHEKNSTICPIGPEASQVSIFGFNNLVSVHITSYKLELQAMKPDGTVIDTLTINKPKPKPRMELVSAIEAPLAIFRNGLDVMF